MKKTRRKNAMGIDVRRTIRKSFRRFVSIAVITLLGTMMFSGLQAGCQDLRVSADAFFDDQSLHDLQIVSTGGLTDKDVEAIQATDGVGKAEGICSGDVEVDLKDKGTDLTKLNADFVTLTEDGIDMPYLVTGRLPEVSGEVAVSQKFAKDTGLKKGDSFTVTAGDETPALHATRFTITGVVTDPTDTDNPFSAVSYRTDASSGETIFMRKSDVDMSVFTAVSVEAEGAREIFSFSDEYTRLVDAVRSRIESDVLHERESARFDEIKAEAEGTLADAKAEADEKLADAENELKKSQKELDDAQAEIDKNQADLDAGEAYARSRLPEGTDLPYLTWSNINDAQKKIDEAQDQVTEGRKKLAEGREEYEKKKAEAEAKIRDAEEEIRNLKTPIWYVRDRMNIGGYSNISSDADSIEAIGAVFPVVFFIVAFLVCLSTITRMVEEERGLIGTYKSLGFTAREIRRKYLIFAGCACALGCLIGTGMAFLGMPAFLFTVFRIMYLLPAYQYAFLPVRALAGAGIFLLGVLIAAAFATRTVLREVPATLLRPKAPPLGSRIFLEKMHLWGRFSFLGKVTARNLFRYKKRMLMTIFGIGGCMALILFGCSIRDSVSDLRPRQYDQIFRYDALAVSSGENADLMEETLDEDKAVKDYLAQEMQTVVLYVENDIEKSTEVHAQAVIVPDEADLTNYVNLKADGRQLTLGEGDVFCTLNAARVAGFDEGDTIDVQLADLTEAHVKVTHVVDNYLSNYLYMTKVTFEKLFDGETYEENSAFIHLNLPHVDQAAWAEELKDKDGVMTAVSIQKQKDDFEATFHLMNIIVLIVIVMSALLAFTVLFTLSQINISEREREIATMKVLGFYSSEVHSYIHRETWILTVIGVILGMPLGRLFAESLVIILNLPSIYLAVSLHPVSFLYSAVLCVSFALAVSFLTNRSLNEIDPVTALKSVE